MQNVAVEPTKLAPLGAALDSCGTRAPLFRSRGCSRLASPRSTRQGHPSRRCVFPRTSGCAAHRYYDPTTGEFLTVDPDVASTKQPYTYAGDDPVNATDPSGEKTIGVCIDAYAISAVFGHGSLGFISGCLVWNYATAVAVTVTEGQGDSNGLDGGGDITVGVQSSTAGNPYDLAGPFNFSYRSVGAVAVGASVNIFWNSDGTVKGLQAEGGVGPDVGYAQGNGTSDTQVFPIAFIRGIGDSGQIVAAVADHSLITSVVDEALQNAGQAPISLSRAVGLIADGSVYWCGS